MLIDCSKCLAEVEDDQIRKCEVCELDGLCDECFNDHNCEGSANR